MLTKEESDLLCLTGPGTRCGELMRRYWQPVALSEEVTADGAPLPVRLFGEALVLFRDSQGRVRKEITFSGFGPMAASGEPKSFVVISDPVAKSNFVLHPDTKVAEQMGHAGHEMKGLARGSAFEEKMQARQEAEIAAGTLKKEDLGTQVIGGVSTQGTRLTHTIPAGQIGNEKPILVVHETWFSNDLQIVVMSKRSNPMGGTTTYTLTNIQRTEPAASLFAVPSDYTVKQGGPGKRGMGKFKQGAPMPPPSEN